MRSTRFMRAQAKRPGEVELPHWAVHIGLSVTASGETEARMDRSIGFNTTLLGNGSTLLKGPGVFVVALPIQAKSDDVDAALNELSRVSKHENEILAIAFPMEWGTAPPDYVNVIANQGVALVRDPGEDPLARSIAYVKRVLGLRDVALAHLQRTRTGRP